MTSPRDTDDETIEVGVSPPEAGSRASAFSILDGFIPRPEIERALHQDGIESPSEPQRLAFQPILSGKHVVLDSGTGTGKTLAYLLPLLQRLAAVPEGRVVVLAPAAELAVQTLHVANRYKSPNVAAAAIQSGGNQRIQKESLQKSTRLITGTPGKILEAIGARKLKGVTTFVLDEPEPILASKEAAFLREILSRPPRPQVVLVGATFGKNSENLIEWLGEGVVLLKAEESPLRGLITHHRLRVRDVADRDLQLTRFLQKEDQDRVIVYVNQPHLIRHVFRNLNDAGISTVTLSQDRTKQQCQNALREFSRGEVQVLLTTDRAATGIDVQGVPWVVHYELPRSPQGYVHRAGRTGRAGIPGRSLAFASDAERFILKGLEKELGISFEELRV